MNDGSATRRVLNFASVNDVRRDVIRLRPGYVRAGAWTLPQICAHLDAAVASRMAPSPATPNTPEQDARRVVKEQVLATGRLPAALPMPAGMTPPPVDLGDAAIDAFLATLDRFERYAGPLPAHRLFGNLTDAEARQINLIHCAHHLSHLVPTT